MKANYNILFLSLTGLAALPVSAAVFYTAGHHGGVTVPEPSSAILLPLAAVMLRRRRP